MPRPEGYQYPADKSESINIRIHAENEADFDIIEQLGRYNPNQLPSFQTLYGGKFSLTSLPQKNDNDPTIYDSFVNPNLIFIAENAATPTNDVGILPHWVKDETADRPPRWILDTNAIIGRGGSGEVYQAWDTKHKEIVAIKITLGEENHIKYEAAAAANANHPNVVRVIEYVDKIELNGKVVSALIMEHLGPEDGLWLHDIVSNHRLPTVSEHGQRTTDLEFIISIIYQLGIVLTYLAENQKSQLDLKLENIFIKKTGELVLTDFGISIESIWRKSNPGVQNFTALKPTGTLNPVNTQLSQGTPGYMSPETYLNKPNPEDIAALQRDSVYCMAIIVFELLTGQKLFPQPQIADEAGLENQPELLKRIRIARQFVHFHNLATQPLSDEKYGLLVKIKTILDINRDDSETVDDNEITLTNIIDNALDPEPQNRYFSTPQELATLLIKKLKVASKAKITLEDLHQAAAA